MWTFDKLGDGIHEHKLIIETGSTNQWDLIFEDNILNKV